jgi:hypothetical protein
MCFKSTTKREKESRSLGKTKLLSPTCSSNSDVSSTSVENPIKTLFISRSYQPTIPSARIVLFIIDEALRIESPPDLIQEQREPKRERAAVSKQNNISMLRIVNYSMVSVCRHRAGLKGLEVSQVPIIGLPSRPCAQQKNFHGKRLIDYGRFFAIKD